MFFGLGKASDFCDRLSLIQTLFGNYWANEIVNSHLFGKENLSKTCAKVL